MPGKVTTAPWTLDAPWCILAQMPVALFTSDNAREMARRSVEARRRYAEARRQREATREATVAALLVAPAPSQDTYVERRLACVRAQLGRIDAMLLQETDPQRLDRLAAACARLSEVERQLAGRPAPGAYRPSVPRRRSADIPALVPE